ncbi:hypothetical protein ABID13_005712 [Enterocloster citroniae]|uniref:Uncharacterized protein n=1 Tax=Enterocloster citroniae TaxID=358743 RepID=A0ABV2G7C6_9FIRM
MPDIGILSFVAYPILGPNPACCAVPDVLIMYRRFSRQAVTPGSRYLNGGGCFCPLASA